ncbi:hypothetical protein Efla_005152 [Eimeria flavescens]
MSMKERSNGGEGSHQPPACLPLCCCGGPPGRGPLPVQMARSTRPTIPLSKLKMKLQHAAAAATAAGAAAAAAPGAKAPSGAEGGPFALKAKRKRGPPPCMGGPPNTERQLLSGRQRHCPPTAAGDLPVSAEEEAAGSCGVEQPFSCCHMSPSRVEEETGGCLLECTGSSGTQRAVLAIQVEYGDGLSSDVVQWSTGHTERGSAL